MASKRVGLVIKEARLAAGLTQAKLAAKVSGVSADDISKEERGAINLTDAQLKRIAKALDITQSSLLDAPKNKVSGSSSSSSGSSSSSASTSSMRLTATEKRLVKAYRAADTDTRKQALSLLTGKSESSGGVLEVLGDVLGSIIK